MDKRFGRIETCGNKCFVDKGIKCTTVKRSKAAEQTTVPGKATKPKAERVNLRFGEIRVSITCAQKVKLKNEENALIIVFEK